MGMEVVVTMAAGKVTAAVVAAAAEVAVVETASSVDSPATGPVSAHLAVGLEVVVAEDTRVTGMEAAGVIVMVAAEVGATEAADMAVVIAVNDPLTGTTVEGTVTVVQAGAPVRAGMVVAVGEEAVTATVEEALRATMEEVTEIGLALMTAQVALVEEAGLRMTTDIDKASVLLLVS